MDVCDLNKPVSQKGLGSDSGLDQGIDDSSTTMTLGPPLFARIQGIPEFFSQKTVNLPLVALI
jgi:hypothetical protein